MTNNGHQSGQHHPNDLRAHQPAGADGRVRGYGMGAGGADHGAAQPSSERFAPGQAQGQPYGQPPQGYAQPIPQQGQGGYAPQGYPQGYGQQAYGQYGQPAYAPGVYVAPATSQPVQVKKKRGKGFWIAIIIAVICLAAAASVAFLMLSAPQSSSRAGTRGQLEGKTPEEIQAELDRVVEDGMFNISIASVVELADGTSEGELRIENVPGNNYLMKVSIARDDTGDVVYTSDMIEPDYHIQRDTLDVDLDQGTYPCTATFTAFDPDTEAEVGQAAAKITIQVKG